MNKPTDLTKTVEETLEELGVKSSDNLLLALSGGTDSMALLHVLLKLQGQRRGKLDAAHLDHSVRGHESLDDSLHLRSMCSELGIGIVTDRLDGADVQSLSRRHRSLEAALRILRYRFLEKAADRLKSDWILTAHQTDDQAETVLFRVARRMDWRSMNGIPSREGRIIRPLLGIRRKTLSNYCAMLGVRPLEDSSNRDLSFSRNHIRHVVIPAMEEAWHSDIHHQLIRVSNAASALARWEGKALNRYVSEMDFDPPNGILRSELDRVPSLLRERAALAILEKTMIPHPKGSVLRETSRLLAKGNHGRVRLSDDLELIVGMDKIVLVERTKQYHPPSVPERELNVPGKIDIPELGLTLQATESSYNGKAGFPEGDEALVCKSALKLPLRVRTGFPGDRFWPLGMESPKTLRRFLMDKKVPRYDRDSIVIVLDSEGKIIWVAGLEISQTVRLAKGEPSKALHLKIDGIRSSI